jgi:hypothetical protein
MMERRSIQAGALAQEATACIRRRSTRALYVVRRNLRRAFRQGGMLPRLIIAGAQKAGTTSLYEYLCQDCRIKRAMVKEVHYFDFNYDRGLPWYRVHFPIRTPGCESGQLLYLEASPYYMYHPEVPVRIQRQVPDAHIVFLLRHPARRAYSHFRHNRRLGLEPLSDFGQAIKAERDRLRASPGIESYDSPTGVRRRFSYLDRGRYSEQLARWYSVFPAGQLHLFVAEELFGETDAVITRLLARVGLESLSSVDSARVYNRGWLGKAVPRQGPQLEYLVELERARLTERHPCLTRGIERYW